MALTEDTPRTFLEVLNGGILVDAPLEALAVVFKGAAIGLDSVDQAHQPLEDGDVFMGIAVKAVTGGAADGDETVRFQQGGYVELPIAAVAAANIGAAVAATDDGTFTLTTASNSTVGHVVEVPVTGTAVVKLKVPGASIIAAQTAAAQI